jgi:uncharacterized protein YpmB
MFEDTRKTIKFIIIVLVLLVIFYLAGIFVYWSAGARSRGNQEQIAEIAKSKTPIRQVKKYYHLDRGISSYSLYGKSQKGQAYYFVYRTHAKKGYLYPASKGYSEAAIRKEFRQNHQTAIRQVNLGWYQGRPVWEVASQKADGSLAYYLYNFKDGKSISAVENL